MGNKPGTGTSSNVPTENTRRNRPTDIVDTDVDNANGRVTVYDSDGETDGTTTPTSAAGTTPGTWRTTGEETSTRAPGTSPVADQSVGRQGASMMTIVISLIVLALLIYFVWQFLF